ncbi:hypothetical protein HZB01_01610 [Candidatus Woesearchaeota archaeon]|nr:hypothetical protein [Candidatus Woesearchaeota archaeon]
MNIRGLYLKGYRGLRQAVGMSTIPIDQPIVGVSTSLTPAEQRVQEQYLEYLLKYATGSQTHEDAERFLFLRTRSGTKPTPETVHAAYEAAVSDNLNHMCYDWEKLHTLTGVGPLESTVHEVYRRYFEKETDHDPSVIREKLGGFMRFTRVPVPDKVVQAAYRRLLDREFWEIYFLKIEKYYTEHPDTVPDPESSGYSRRGDGGPLITSYYKHEVRNVTRLQKLPFGKKTEVVYGVTGAFVPSRNDYTITYQENRLELPWIRGWETLYKLTRVMPSWETLDAAVSRLIEKKLEGDESEKIRELFNFIGVPPPKSVQRAYHLLTKEPEQFNKNYGMIMAILGSTGIPPAHTLLERLHAAHADAMQNGNYKFIEHLRKLEGSSKLSSHSVVRLLGPTIRSWVLEHWGIDFSDFRPDPDVVQHRYHREVDSGNLHSVMGLWRATDIPPDEDLIQAKYSTFAKEEKFEELREWEQATGIVLKKPLKDII